MTPTPATAFRERFLRELVQAFNLSELTRLAMFKLDVVLANEVFTQTAFETVAFEFVGWCLRNGRLGDLVAAVADDKPGVAVLQALRQQFDSLPPAAAPTAADFSRFAKLFADRLPNLDYLKAYKELHEILHALDGKLASFRPEADARATAGTPIPTGSADYLRGSVANAKEWVAQVQYPATFVWVARFEVAVGEFLSDDPKMQKRAIKYIENLPAQELRLLNSKLVDCARGVEVEDLAEILNWRLDGLPKLSDSVSGFRKVCVRIRDLITAHDLCQLIDTELRAEGEGERVASTGDLRNWDELRGWFDHVAGVRGFDPLTAATMMAVDAFESGKATSGVDLFAHLTEKFRNQFERVDKELLDATQPLLTAAFRLANFLGNPQ